MLRTSMQRVVALLATVLVSIAPLACGDDGAEPGASTEATLVLDFQPNAVHAGIYAALREGYYRGFGIDLQVREPSSSTDSPKLLEAGRAQFAILDIHDLAIAYERGLDVSGIVPIVQRPLAAVIARNGIRRPGDLQGKTVGVTGLPSDDAVLDSVLEADGADPSSVDRVTIGFQAVAALAAGRIDAATAFWNAEGVTLRRQGVSARVFRVDDHGAPRYPELWLCTSTRLTREQPGLARAISRATVRGYGFAADHPQEALNDLLASSDGLDRAEQEAQLRALLAADAVDPSDAFLAPAKVSRWLRWATGHGILERPLERPPARMFSAL
jgi:NitT/TauT family transport system substrate-binding protein/putative hydroxymethylpyrimidine transport system substrate-binding protein